LKVKYILYSYYYYKRQIYSAISKLQGQVTKSIKAVIQSTRQPVRL